jgi:hypothetical protein
MAYPGVNWRTLTVAVFYGRLSLITHCRSILDGNYTAEMHHKYMQRLDRKELFAKAKHPSFFPEVEF